MNLGLSKVGNNWKLIIGNFLIMFFAQLVFNFNDVFSEAEVWPSSWMLCKITVTSLATTLIFYGFNKWVLTKEP